MRGSGGTSSGGIDWETDAKSKRIISRVITKLQKSPLFRKAWDRISSNTRGKKFGIASTKGYDIILGKESGGGFRPNSGKRGFKTSHTDEEGNLVEDQMPDTPAKELGGKIVISTELVSKKSRKEYAKGSLESVIMEEVFHAAQYDFYINSAEDAYEDNYRPTYDLEIEAKVLTGIAINELGLEVGSNPYNNYLFDVAKTFNSSTLEVYNDYRDSHGLNPGIATNWSNIVDTYGGYGGATSYTSFGDLKPSLLINLLGL